MACLSLMQSAALEEADVDQDELDHLVATWGTDE